jgi:hypothetical protein
VDWTALITLGKKEKRARFWSGVVAYTCNRSHLGRGGLEDCSSRASRAKSEASSQSISRAWWPEPMIPVKQEALDKRIAI